jgi:pimeloyl-ACP methyl ester carboxylesterase
MKRIQTKTIVFITGAFMSNSIWDEWRTYFERNGYITIAPSWPHKDATTEELKLRHPDKAIASVDLQQLVEHYAEILQYLPEKTILIGHSAGGLVTQLLLQRDLAVAGIVIHSFPPHGVMTFKLSFLRSAFGPMGLLTPATTSYLMSFSHWQYAIANGMSLAQQKAGYEQFLVPESKKILRAGLLGGAKMDFSRMHVPLLFIAGSDDHLIPASLNFSNYKHYKHHGSITDFKEFKGKNHFAPGQSAWREEAAFILQWIDTL